MEPNGFIAHQVETPTANWKHYQTLLDIRYIMMSQQFTLWYSNKLHMGEH